jgi:hypothetical protein
MFREKAWRNRRFQLAFVRNNMLFLSPNKDIFLAGISAIQTKDFLARF